METTFAAAPSPALCAIAVMAKASRPGLTKTRLAPPLTPEEAADFNTAFLKDIVHNIGAAAQQASIAPYLAYGPPGSEAFFETHMPPGVGRFETWLDGFGHCLFFAIETLFARGHRAACVLNSDSPTLPTRLLVELAEALAAPGDRAVIGPAEDGGYYVLGLKTPHRRLFDRIDWSTAAVFEQTVERAAEISLPVHVLPAWYDVDDADGLRRLRSDLFEAPHADDDRLRPSAAGHTRLLLERMIETGRLSS
jgi:rSAM/selenodomain-associated transferase 1